MRLAEVGAAGQARLAAAHVPVNGCEGALTELVYLERAGVGAVSLDALAQPVPFAHAQVFRHAAPRRHAAGAWRALRAITGIVTRTPA
ncbi:MAG TPA: hypothetical protein VGQ57_13035 [Polyangiaceae bacterium]|jgi:hypothetical protein|nr:hypothetical protein [Polyangiaceae bacterium]